MKYIFRHIKKLGVVMIVSLTRMSNHVSHYVFRG